jgi:hypothetical protein
VSGGGINVISDRTYHGESKVVGLQEIPKMFQNGKSKVVQA